MIAEVQYREVGSNHIGKTSYTGNNLTRASVVEFFGLDKPDIEWYSIDIH